MDFLQYIPKDKTWIDIVAKHIGYNKLFEYYNRVFLKLYLMEHGEWFCIAKKVDPQNYDLFIKCAITAISELASYGIYDFTIEDKAAVLLRL